MNIEDDESIPDEKAIKVQIPGELYVKLHSVKLLTGETLKDQIATALETHFEDQDTLPEAEPDA